MATRRRKKNGRYAPKGGKKREKRRSPKRRAAASRMQRDKNGRFKKRRTDKSKKRTDKSKRRTDKSKKRTDESKKRRRINRINRQHNGLRVNRHMRKRAAHLFRKGGSGRGLSHAQRDAALSERNARATAASSHQMTYLQQLRARRPELQANRVAANMASANKYPSYNLARKARRRRARR